MAATGEYGNCVAEDECRAKNGILGGPCADGFGICCICKYMTACDVSMEN